MRRYDTTILIPTILTVAIGVVLIVISKVGYDAWTSNLMVGFGINILTIGLTLLFVDMYRWITRRKAYKQSYRIVVIDLKSILGRSSVWLLRKYVLDDKDQKKIDIMVNFDSEDTFAATSEWVSSEILRIVDNDSELKSIKSISELEAKWLLEAVTDSEAKLRTILDLYPHLIDDPVLIDQIAKLRKNIYNAQTALLYLSGDSTIPLSEDSAISSIKHMYRSYAGLTRHLNDLQ